MTYLTIDTQENIRSAFEQLLGAMVERSDQAAVKLVPSERRPVLVLAVNRCDYGAVLGKSHSTLDALKLLAAMAGNRYGLEVELMLDSSYAADDGSVRRGFKAAADWDGEPLEKLATLFCCALLGPCQVSLAAVSSSSSRLTVTPTTVNDIEDDDVEISLEKALGLVFNCAGAMQGRRVTVELVA